MKIFNKTKILKKYKGSALAIGNFDGVHRGHQKIFKLAKKFAKKHKVKFELTTNPIKAVQILFEKLLQKLLKMLHK